LQAAIEEFIPPQWFSRWSVHGNAGWTPQKLAWVALLMCWDEGSTLGERFHNVRALVKTLHPRWKLPNSYPGFVQALTRHTDEMRNAIVRRLRPKTDAPCWRIHGWLALAVDGSRFEAPRTVANEQMLKCAGKDGSSPQVFQTTIQHLGTGLPWDFRLGPGTDSERRHLDDMLPGLPPQALLMADAGFVSFDLCTWLCSKGHYFLLRVGGNIQLLTELGYEHEVQGQTVYLWPQSRRGQTPLVLRLIVVCDAGKRPVYLLTNVSDRQQLSDQQAADLYRLRWEIELYYRTAKQTFGHHQLLSHSPQAALLEQTWIVLGLWLMQSMTLSAVKATGRLPQDCSPAKARTILRRTMRRALSPSHICPKQPLRERLGGAIKDRHLRRGPKQTRAHPRKKEQRPPNPPQFQVATERQRQHAQQLWLVAPLKS
jgi:hypothetical protein